MPYESYEQLVQIKWILLALLVCVVATLLFFAVVAQLRIRAQNSTMVALQRDMLIAEMAMHERQGEYADMLLKSAELLEVYPSDLVAYWYNALGNWKLGQHGAALSALAQIQEINAVWSAEQVESLIVQIRSEMGGPKRTS